MGTKFTDLSLAAQALWFHLLMVAKNTGNGWLTVHRDEATRIRKRIRVGSDVVRELLTAEWIVAMEEYVCIGVWATREWERLAPCRDLLGGDDDEYDQPDGTADG